MPVSETVHRIEKVLIKCGVLGITKEYGNTAGDIMAIRFHVKTEGPDLTIRLPVNKERCLDALWEDYVDGDKLSADGKSIQWSSRKKKRKSDFEEQAARTAWKIVQDWVEVQMSMIQTRQAETVEVFLPYIYDGRETVFNRIKAGGYRALLPEST